MPRYAALDLETTGFSAERDEIIEFAAVLFDEHGVEEGSFTTLLNPGRQIPPPATRVHGITDRMVSSAPIFATMAQEVQRCLDGRILVGHNVAAFDVKFLVNAFTRAGVYYEPVAVLDTLTLARIALPGLKSHRLGELCHLAGIKNDTAHRAESDARATWHLLCALSLADMDDLTNLDKYNLPIVGHSIPESLVATRPRPVSPDLSLAQTCAGEVVVFTGGRPDGYRTREDAAKEVLRRGGRVSNSISKKTTAVFAGDNAGGKLDKARELSKPTYPHAAFADFLLDGHSGALGAQSVIIKRHDGQVQNIAPGAIDPLITEAPPTTSKRPQPSNPGKREGQTVPPNPERQENARRTEGATTPTTAKSQATPPRVQYRPASNTSTKPPLEPTVAQNWPPPTTPASSGTVPGEPRNWTAVASLVCALLWLFWFGSLLAVVLGHRSLRSLSRSGYTRGRRLAVAGLVIGYLGFALLVIGSIGAAMSA